VSLPQATTVRLSASAEGLAPEISRFHIASLTFRRAQQLKLGARPRVEADGHKVTTVALLEVLANTISWSRV
jgi:DNA-directed RNA polymerase subunit K/omega